MIKVDGQHVSTPTHTESQYQICHSGLNLDGHSFKGKSHILIESLFMCMIIAVIT